MSKQTLHMNSSQTPACEAGDMLDADNVDAPTSGEYSPRRRFMLLPPQGLLAPKPSLNAILWAALENVLLSLNDVDVRLPEVCRAATSANVDAV